MVFDLIKSITVSPYGAITEFGRDVKSCCLSAVYMQVGSDLKIYTGSIIMLFPYLWRQGGFILFQ